MKKFFAEFKKFISRGNVMDMAVGVVVGGAFTAIVNSLVKDIINPVLGLFGTANLENLKWVIKSTETEVNGEMVVTEVALMYGAFISAVINFLIVAFVLFCVIRAMNKVADGLKKPEAPAEPAKEPRKCPYCLSVVDDNATRCPFCTSSIVISAEEALK